MRRALSRPLTCHLGHPWTEKEKGRGTLQTSALPPGYSVAGENGCAMSSVELSWRGRLAPASQESCNFVTGPAYRLLPCRRQPVLLPLDSFFVSRMGCLEDDQ